MHGIRKANTGNGLLAWTASLLMVLAMPGCPHEVEDSDEFADVAITAEIEPNDSLSAATPVALDSAGRARLQGAMSAGEKWDEDECH